MQKILLLFGGRSREHDVSVASARHLFRALSALPVSLYTLGVGKDGALYRFTGDATDLTAESWFSHTRRLSLVYGGDCPPVLIEEGRAPYTPDLVFSAIHGDFGEDGALQGLLTLCGIPFIGCGILSSAVGMHKSAAKTLARAAGVPVVPWAEIFPGEDADEKITAASLSYPLFVKPNGGGSSLGARPVSSRRELTPALREAWKYAPSALAEKSVTGREIEVALLEKNGEILVSAPGEIRVPDGFYDYDTKYRKHTAETLVPAPLSKSEAEEGKRLARTVFRALYCRGLARVDFFLTADGFFFNEINTLPGFTEISMFPKLFAREGVDPVRFLTGEP